MKFYTYERPDLARIIGILIILGYFLALNVKVTLYVIAAAVVFLLLIYVAFLLLDLDFDRERDALEDEIPFVDSYDEYRQTGVDRRSYSKKSNNSKPDNSKLCEPCKFTGVANEAAQVYSWGDWSDKPTTKNTKQ